MSMIRQRGSVGGERSAEADLEGNIHELVRRDSSAGRQTDGESEAATRTPRPAVKRLVGITSTAPISET